MQRFYYSLHFLRLCKTILITFEIDLAIPILIKHVDDPLHERILLQFRKCHEFLDAQRSVLVQVHFLESFRESTNLVRFDLKRKESRRKQSKIDVFVVGYNGESRQKAYRTLLYVTSYI